MDWRAKLEQQQNALLLTFYMFVAMTLMVIRTGLAARAAAGSFPLGPMPDSETFPRNWSSGDAMADYSPPSLEDHLNLLYADALALLYAAELAARRLAGLSRAIYELMGHAHAIAQSLRDQTTGMAGHSRKANKRLDAP